MAAPVKAVAAIIGSLGLWATLQSGYVIVRGPFLGGPTLAPKPLLVSLGMFVVGIAVTAWGVTRYVRA